MEKFSKWRDPSTGIQPFLPLQAPRGSPLVVLLVPFNIVVGLLRAVLLAVLFVLYMPFALANQLPAARLFTSPFIALLARTALGVLGYYWIPTETVSAKRGKKGIAQAVPPVRGGDLIIANWTGYVDVLYYLFRYNPTFLLPIFTSSATSDAFGRSSGTGSASIRPPASSSECAGYAEVSALSMLARTGSLPPSADDIPNAVIHKTLADARRKATGPLVLFPEATTSNGRAVLRFVEGVLSEEMGDGMVWVKFIRHAAPSAILPAAACPIPSPLAHLCTFVCTLPLPRTAVVRTLHPSASPSSPSFLPSEVLATQPAGLTGVRDERVAWREACAVVLAETGRVRRVPGMGWVEKESFLDYYAKSQRR